MKKVLVLGIFVFLFVVPLILSLEINIKTLQEHRIVIIIREAGEPTTLESFHLGTGDGEINIISSVTVPRVDILVVLKKNETIVLNEKFEDIQNCGNITINLIPESVWLIKEDCYINQRISALEENVSVLQFWQQTIENWKSTITETIDTILTTITGLVTTIDDHEKRITNLENETSQNNTNNFPNYFKYLTASDRKKMVCGYAEDNHLGHIEDLGYSCDLTYRTSNTGKVSVRCSCERK